MNIIGRIAEAATTLELATGVRANYVYLGESEVLELRTYVMKHGGIPLREYNGATVYDLRVLTVISASHLAVS